MGEWIFGYRRRLGWYGSLAGLTLEDDIWGNGVAQTLVLSRRRLSNRGAG